MYLFCLYTLPSASTIVWKQNGPNNTENMLIWFVMFCSPITCSTLVERLRDHTSWLHTTFVCNLSSPEGTVSVDYNSTNVRHVHNWYSTVAPSEIGLMIIIIIKIHSNYTRRNIVPTGTSCVMFSPWTCVQSLSSERHACRHRDSVSGPNRAGSQDIRNTILK